MSEVSPKYPSVIVSSTDREFLLKAASVPGTHQVVAQSVLLAECQRIARTAGVDGVKQEKPA